MRTPTHIHTLVAWACTRVRRRAWMTEKLMADYFEDRTFYTLQSEGTVDNPDQRISSDVV